MITVIVFFVQRRYDDYLYYITIINKMLNMRLYLVCFFSRKQLVVRL